MDMNQRAHAAVKLRAELHRNTRLRLEYLASMSRLFREHGVAIEDDSLANMVPADIAELHAGPPGGPRPSSPSIPGGPRPSTPGIPGGPRPASGPAPSGHS